MKNLKDTLFWKKKYGVLPLHLKDINEDRYLMLNGVMATFVCKHLTKAMKCSLKSMHGRQIQKLLDC